MEYERDYIMRLIKRTNMAAFVDSIHEDLR